MAMGCFQMLLGQNMKGTGLMINNMDKELKLGEKFKGSRHLIQDSFLKGRRMVRVNFNGKMVVIIKEILLMEIFKDLEVITSLNQINTMKENLDLAIWKEEELRLGQMEEDMKVTLKMARKMEKAHSNGQMVSNILEVGELENNKEQEFYIILKMEAKNKENGKMESEFDGSKAKMIWDNKSLHQERESDCIFVGL